VFSQIFVHVSNYSSVQALNIFAVPVLHTVYYPQLLNYLAISANELSKFDLSYRSLPFRVLLLDVKPF